MIYNEGPLCYTTGPSTGLEHELEVYPNGNALASDNYINLLRENNNEVTICISVEENDFDNQLTLTRDQWEMFLGLAIDLKER